MFDVKIVSIVGHIGGFQLLVVELVPVILVEEGVQLELYASILMAQTVFLVSEDELVDEVNDFVREARGFLGQGDLGLFG